MKKRLVPKLDSALSRPCLCCLALFAVILCVSFPDCEGAETEERATDRSAQMKVMSFNILDYTNNANNWHTKSGSSRCDKVVKTIKKHDPDVIGFQEDLEIQDKDIEKAFPGKYEWYGIGGKDGKREGRFNSIFYRTSRFICIAKGTIWLSDTPDIPGSVFRGVSVRTATWVKLYDRNTKQAYFILNAHWDNGYQHARDGSAKIFRERIPRLAGDLPVIVTGDLNAHDDNRAFLKLLGKDDPDGFQLLDSHRVLNPEKREDEGTSHGFGGSPKGARIDYILHSKSVKPIESIVDREPVDGHWASDHFAIITTFEVPVADGD